MGCRHKVTHAQGDVAKIQWEDLGGHSYTGMFKGADTGFVRLSVAKPVDTTTPSLGPSMGLKMLRDGVDSANMLAIYNIDGQESLDFFANDMVNHIPTPGPDLALLLKRFKKASNWVQTLGSSEMASMT